MEKTTKAAHPPKVVDRLEINLTKNSLYATNLQGLMCAYQAHIIVFLCGIMAVLEVIF